MGTISQRYYAAKVSPSDLRATIARRVAGMEAALVDANADISVTLGGLTETTRARIVQGRVLVEWEPDDSAGGVLLRPVLVRRLLALNARVRVAPHNVLLQTPPRVMRALSPAHAALADRFPARRAPELLVRLRFAPASGDYQGGDETYSVSGVCVLTVSVRLQPRGSQSVATN